MADLRDQQHEEVDGATPGELLIEAARRNNTDLLQEVIDGCGSLEKAAILLNETKTAMGNHVYHEAALRGNYEIIDTLLDQTGFECDPLTTLEGDTPLHSAIRYLNSLPSPPSPAITTFSHDLINMMIEAGSDPRIRNKAHLTPYQLVDPRNEDLRRLLQDAVDVVQNQGDYIVGNGEEDGGDGVGDEGDVGSGSDSDFDPEEYRREKERREQERKVLANGGKA